MHLDRQNETTGIDLPRLSTVEELLIDLAAGGTGVSELPLGQRWLLVSPHATCGCLREYRVAF